MVAGIGDGQAVGVECEGHDANGCERGRVQNRVTPTTGVLGRHKDSRAYGIEQLTRIRVGECEDYRAPARDFYGNKIDAESFPVCGQATAVHRGGDGLRAGVDD